MCLAVPGRIVEIDDDGLFSMAVVDFCGVRRKICVDTVPDAVPGMYVVAHAGVAISLMDPAEAEATLRDLDDMAFYRDSLQ